MSVGRQRAGSSKAVATEKISTTEAGTPSTAPAPAPEAVTEPAVEESTNRRCCSDGETVYTTDGFAAEPIDYCKTHLPANAQL